jgi:hypothetical protein
LGVDPPKFADGWTSAQAAIRAAKGRPASTSVVPVILMNLRLPIADFPVVIVFIYAAAMCSPFHVALQWRRLKIKKHIRRALC